MTNDQFSIVQDHLVRIAEGIERLVTLLELSQSATIRFSEADIEAAMKNPRCAAHAADLEQLWDATRDPSIPPSPPRVVTWSDHDYDA